MSPLSRNDLSIVLSPASAALLSSGTKLTLRGTEHAIFDRAVIPSANRGEMLWSGALEALGAALPRFARHGMQATVILSNHFVSYVLVPWYDNLSDEDEIAHAQHCFKELYGDTADGWEVRVSPNSAGLPALASAVDTRLLDELHGMLEGAGLSIKSIQPHLMAAFNCCRHSLQGRNAWFALLEPGNLCLGILQKGQFSWMRKMRIGNAWNEELSMHLEREAYLAEGGGVTNDVLLWAPQHENRDTPGLARWNIQYLRPSMKQGGHQMCDELRIGGIE